MPSSTIDFSRSFVTFRIDADKKPPATVSHKPPFSLNNARIQLECRCRIEEKAAGNMRSFVLGASCKTERVGVERDIWTDPNADFAPMFSDDRFMALKTFSRADIEVDLYPLGSGKQSIRQTGMIADVFDSVRIDVVERDGELLCSPQAIVEATLANHPLVARTIIETDRYAATIEYPIKTMNANERDWIYQTDTGPILLPDLSVEPDSLMERFEFAFAAFNCPEWIELIVRVPTQVADDISVFHYDRSLRLDVKNEVVRLL
ncbi:MAG: hypothetical protein CMJ64_14655 [Planctomycetaceae bacterium]|nr:hypothetical protein [Planctomycetaceae bacterium]